jgi:hypothetical protein
MNFSEIQSQNCLLNEETESKDFLDLVVLEVFSALRTHFRIQRSEATDAKCVKTAGDTSLLVIIFVVFFKAYRAAHRIHFLLLRSCVLFILLALLRM